MARLKNPEFQTALITYKRKDRVFLIAHSAQDEVSSEWLVRGLDGKEYKPVDYLTAFSEYVKLHQTDIDAIGILLNRPQDWTPDALGQLRDKLKTTPQRFTEDNLRKAHAIRYQKPVVDIISMVKHAANEQNPLLTSFERVDAAFAHVIIGKEFTAEQQQWLQRIRIHMVENLSIDQEDFEAQPVFNHYGGWGRVSKVFEGQLPGLIKELNQAIAA